jgi:DNA-directed RNA polymerase beta subunit
MEKAGIPADGKVQLFNGKTGDAFKETNYGWSQIYA